MHAPLGKGLLVAVGAIAAACNAEKAPPPAEHTGQASSALFTNGGFEDGTNNVAPPNWTVTLYQNKGVTILSPQTRAGLNLLTNGNPTARTVTLTTTGPEAKADDNLGTGASLRWPKFGKAVAVVNLNGKDYNVNSMKQTMTIGAQDIDGVDGLAHVRFAVAPVLQDPNHSAEQQPYFFIQLTNVTQGNAILYQDFNFANQPGVPWKQVGTGNNAIKYTDWALVDIAPGSAKLAPGDQVELEVIAAGCSQNGHWGYVYVDGASTSVPGLFVAATGPASANQNTDITYTLNYKNGGAALAAGTVIEFNTPPNTTFTSFTVPAGITCTAPAVGSAGLVKCTIGDVAVDGSGSFKITTHINNGIAPNQITAGNYSIYATGVSPLLGPKVYTDVTDNVTYADIGVTMTGPTPATTSSGGTATYTITVTNKGPNNATGVSVKDPLPSQFSGATWTCVATGGATCTAAGTDGINDPAVSIPVGGTLTYTLTATVSNTAAAGQIGNIATVAVPAGAKDPDPSNNSVGVYIQNLVPNGQGCTAVGDCVSNVCDPKDNKCGWADTDGPCTAANQTVVCRSGQCSADGTCVTAGGCNVDDDCAGGKWCSISTHTCTAKIANDNPVATDPAHSSPTLNGTCTAPAANLTCESGVCDVKDNKCGYDTGTGPCTAADAATVCRSGACSNNGTCMPSAGCNVDGDCAAGKWCNMTSHACTAQVSNGSPLPTDGAHSGPTLDGKCAQDAAALTCVSAVCDTTDDKCGYANGTGPCTDTNAATVCRSGACGDDGKCMPGGGCNIDSDCPSGNWCNISGHACVAKAPNGGAVGSDEDHSAPTLDGKCSPDAATLTCASGVCDKSDDKCGYIDGNGPCTTGNAATVCRSGACSSTGVCKPVTGCNTDADCDRSSQFCDTGAHKCTAKLDNGAAMPTVSDHTPGLDGKCTAEAAAVVCKSNVCDPSDNKCGYNNGNGPCSVTSAATVCRSGACDPKDNKCGLQDDSGPCSNDRACRSGNCNESKNVCGSGCTTDSECASNEFCRTSDGVCTLKLPDGDPCSSENMCQSNACNAQMCDSIVAEGNGIGCSVQPGSDSNSGASSAAVFGIALGVASLARKRRRSGSSAR